jgi:hypothetical protein
MQSDFPQDIIDASLKSAWHPIASIHPAIALSMTIINNTLMPTSFVSQPGYSSEGNSPVAYDEAPMQNTKRVKVHAELLPPSGPGAA